MRAIWKRELKSYFQTVTGWLFIAATLALFGLYFYVYNMYYGSTDISSTLSAVTFLFLVTVPILTMRTLAEERKNKTDQLIFNFAGISRKSGSGKISRHRNRIYH